VLGTICADVPQDAQVSLYEVERTLSAFAGQLAVHLQRTGEPWRASPLSEPEAAEVGRLIVGRCRKMRRIRQSLLNRAASAPHALFIGEPGSGKTLAATTLYASGPQRNGLLMRLSVEPGYSAQHWHSELFGLNGESNGGQDEPRRRPGRLTLAQGGALLLEEPHLLPESVLDALLGVVRGGELRTRADQPARRCSAQILMVISQPLEQEGPADQGDQENARLDHPLFSDEGVWCVQMPPLRQRSGDVMPLAEHFAQDFARQSGKLVRRFSAAATNALLAYTWPGNVSELEQAIEHAVQSCSDTTIHLWDLPMRLQPLGPSEIPWSMTAQVQTLETDLIVEALQQAAGNVSAAARNLGVTPRIVRYRIRTLGIQYDPHRNRAWREPVGG
jgi:Nif-specific regulatory protein